MNNMISFLFAVASISTAVLLKKTNKVEEIKISSKYYYSSILLLIIIAVLCPIPLLKKCFVLLTIPPLIYQAFLDIETFELSDILSGYIFLLGIVYTLITKQYQHFFTTFILFSVYTIMSLLGPMGFGDVKLITALGLFVYSYTSLLFYPFLFAALGELIMRLFVKKENSNFAFGPYIILGFYMAIFFLEKTI